MPDADITITIFWFALFIGIIGTLAWSSYVLIAKGRSAWWLALLLLPIAWVAIYAVAYGPAKPYSHWYHTRCDYKEKRMSLFRWYHGEKLDYALNELEGIQEEE